MVMVMVMVMAQWTAPPPLFILLSPKQPRSISISAAAATSLQSTCAGVGASASASASTYTCPSPSPWSRARAAAGHADAHSLSSQPNSDGDGDGDTHSHTNTDTTTATTSSISYHKLEEDVFNFMRTSNKPHAFPTRQELLEAGRTDLADAIAAQGGWLAFGWDLPAPSHSSKAAHTHRHTHTPQLSIPSMDHQHSSHNTGLDAMLKRIEKQRSLAKERKGYAHTQSPRDKPHLHPAERAPFCNKNHLKVNMMSNKPSYLSLQGETLHDYRIIASKNGKSPISNGSANPSTSDRWTRLNLRNDNSSSNDIEAGTTVLTEEKTTLDSDIRKDDFENGRLPNNVGHGGSREMAGDSSLEMGDIRQRIHQLESSLNSALDSVRLRVKKVLSHEINEDTAVTLDNLSDDWEFRETEILEAKDEVRSLRAKISVIEGKMALQIIEAQKLMEENQKKLDEARRHLSNLRNISVVWPNPASEVLLAGSFDGWTSKRSMEKSREGIFSLNLMLYPGKYEIKFIVDGVWTVDPLRPVVKYSGHENNLLTVV